MSKSWDTERVAAELTDTCRTKRVFLVHSAEIVSQVSDDTRSRHAQRMSKSYSSSKDVGLFVREFENLLDGEPLGSECLYISQIVSV